MALTSDSANVRMSGSDHEVHTVVSPNLVGGPKGLGDPDDRSLRVVETEALIPRLVKKRAHAQCHDFATAFNDCGKKEGILAVYKCRDAIKQLNECLYKYYADPKFVQERREEYLNIRSEYRRTGVNPDPDIFR